MGGRCTLTQHPERVPRVAMPPAWGRAVDRAAQGCCFNVNTPKWVLRVGVNTQNEVSTQQVLIHLRVERSNRRSNGV